MASYGKEKLPKAGEDDLTLDRLASIGQIAAGIAHEVKNPLTAVKGFLQLLKEQQSHKYIDVAYEELEHALDTLNNLLQVSKPDLEDEPYSSINICTEIESLLYLFQDQSYHHVTVVRELTDTHERIYAKRNQLKKAFFNLLKNAYEAIIGEGMITIKHYVRSDQLIISISDTGVGIPKEKLNLLGTPFFTSKSAGTGMGLTQVFSTVYDHQGTIGVRSQPGKGTTFIIKFPIAQTRQIGVVKLNLSTREKQDFSQFFAENKQQFAEMLASQGKDLLDAVQAASSLSVEYILQSAQTIANMLIDGNEHAMIMHAKEHGRNWAKHELDLILKLEWIQMLRSLYWNFLYTYHTDNRMEQDEFFNLERSVNYNLDSYLNHFSSSFSEYKQELLQSQREVIQDLTVPVIPLSDAMAILPIVGTMDTLRAKKIQEDVLVKIYELKLKRLIIDLSGVAYMDTAVVSHLFKIVNGIAIQGCKAVITGIRPEITNTMVELGITLNDKAETMGTLKQAIEVYH
ncbi:ATP-binding protein [Gorillibacterium sp. sgz5001074]|uniref:ATP-binding protein n=1 Tax=Gorillibacterium sp. sgz5001074 TaxID=3446695 RepID=UPI003F661AE0